MHYIQIGSCTLTLPLIIRFSTPARRSQVTYMQVLPMKCRNASVLRNKFHSDISALCRYGRSSILAMNPEDIDNMHVGIVRCAFLGQPCAKQRGCDFLPGATRRPDMCQPRIDIFGHIIRSLRFMNSTTMCFHFCFELLLQLTNSHDR
jgi:hypothetical protein